MMALEEIQKLHKPAAPVRANQPNYPHDVNVTILVSCHDWPIQPRLGIDRLELNQIGVIWRQKIGSKIWNRKSRNSLKEQSKVNYKYVDL